MLFRKKKLLFFNRQESQRANRDNKVHQIKESRFISGTGGNCRNGATEKQVHGQRDFNDGKTPFPRI